MNDKTARKASSGRWLNLSETIGTSSDLRQSVKDLRQTAERERQIFSGENLVKGQKESAKG